MLCPYLIDELYDLLIRTVKETEESMPEELLDLVAPWRVVGVPKREPSESRPIAIASVFLRAWHRSISDTLPAFCSRQWSEDGGHARIRRLGRLPG